MSEKCFSRNSAMKHFRECFENMSKTKAVANISVTEISKAVGCSRATFYHYYDGIDHLLFDCICESYVLKKPLAGIETAYEVVYENIWDCLRYAEKYPRIVRTFLRNMPSSSLYRKEWHKSNLKFFLGLMSLLRNNSNDEAIPRMSFARFCCGGYERTLYDYVDEGFVYDIDRKTQILTDTVIFLACSGDSMDFNSTKGDFRN